MALGVLAGKKFGVKVVSRKGAKHAKERQGKEKV
jgi:hypothetical protein